ncbi:MAG: response regulator [Rhodothermaceae bacterium]
MNNNRKITKNILHLMKENILSALIVAVAVVLVLYFNMPEIKLENLLLPAISGVLLILLFSAVVTQVVKKIALPVDKNEKYFSNVIDFSVDGILTTDFKGTIITSNDSLENMFGYKKDEILNKNIDSIFPGIINELYLKDESEKKQNIIREIKGIKKDKEKLLVRIAVASTLQDNNRIYVFNVQDISISKHTEEALRQNKIELENSNKEKEKARKAALSIMQDADIQRRKAEDALTELRISTEQLKKLSRAIEHSPTTVLITDKQGNIEYVNPSFTKTTGYTIKETIGNNLDFLKSNFHDDEFYKNLWDTIESGNVWFGEFKNRRKNGSFYWESASISPIKNNKNEVTHYVSVKEDITQRKQMEIELKKSKELAETATVAKSQFLATMSHEIRTPMNAIIGLSHLVLKTKLDKKQLNYLIKIDQSAHSLLGIINDILDFSKIEAGKLTIENIDFDLEQVISTVSNLVSQKAQEKNLEFAIHISPDVPLNLIGDPLRIGQVITNFCSNAVKFTTEGEVVVSIKLTEKSNGFADLEYCVKDTGIGLSNDQKENLFKAFQQADNSTTRKYGGTGLGLAISKRLVELMGGRIWFESELGKGSSFYFSGKYEILEKQKQKILVPSVDLRGMKVLVCDDNESSRIILTEALEVFTFRVTTVSSGQEALMELENSADDPYKLVLMDWKMPGMDGIETSIKIKSNSNTSIPLILMVTAFGNNDIYEKAKNAGVEGYLTKPITYSSLFDSIMELFGKIVDKSAIIPQKGEKYKNEIALYKNINLLLVEDNEINQQVATELFESAGFTVEVAINGEEAVELVKDSGNPSKYDIVIMDLQMPVMDGYTACREIKKIEEYKNLPVVAMTADAMEGVKEKCHEAGMEGYIAKPIELDEILGVIVKLLKENKKPDQVITEVEDVHKNIELSELTKLSQFSVKDGLRRVAGNVKLYTKFLVRFKEMLIDFPKEFEELLVEENDESAHRLVHTLKGVAANIGCKEIQNASALIEKYFKAENKNSEELKYNLEIFKEKSTIVLDDLNKLEIDKKFEMLH